MKEKSLRFLLGTGAVAFLASLGGLAGWLAVSSRVAAVEERLAAIDASSVENASTLSTRLSGADEAIASGELRDEGISLRVARVEDDAGRVADAAGRSGALETQLIEAVRILQQADDQNVQLIQSYGQALEALERNVEWLSGAWEELPLGTVLAWMPPAGEELPPGWAVCDGTRGTPDLRGLFLRGAGSYGEVGQYVAASTMTASGLHAHDDSSANHTRFGLDWSPSRVLGDARVLFDTDILSDDPETRASHGEHVHVDPNVPEHATVFYIVKLEYVE